MISTGIMLFEVTKLFKFTRIYNVAYLFIYQCMYVSAKSIRKKTDARITEFEKWKRVGFSKTVERVFSPESTKTSYTYGFGETFFPFSIPLQLRIISTVRGGFEMSNNNDKNENVNDTISEKNEEETSFGFTPRQKYLVSATLVTGDHVSVVFAAGGFVDVSATKTAVVRHRATFGTARKMST